MSIVRTAKGTAILKTSGTTLTLESVEILSGRSLVVGVAFDAGEGPPTVKWGNRDLSRIELQSQSGASTALFLLRHIRNTNTRTITCTWTGAIIAKAMFATMIGGVETQDVSQSTGQASTTNPATGPTVVSTRPETISIAAMGSQGPESDDPGTVGSGHTSGQRVGTSGGADDTNVTIHETFEILTQTGNVRATKTGATSRSWSNVILAVKKSLRFKMAISPTDLQTVEGLFEDNSLDWNNHAFRWNASLDRWEAYDVTDIGTLVASMESGDSQWV